MIDYQEICEKLKDEDVFNLLSRLGAEPIEKDDYFMCKTICHHDNADEGHHKLYYYKNTHLFYCYSCCGAMSPFKFLKSFYECRGINYDWFQDIYQVIIDCSNFQFDENFVTDKYSSIRDKYKTEVAPKLQTYSTNVLDCFTKFYTPEWLKDGISKETMDKFNILYSISRNKIIIPHYDVDNNLVGIRGRALNEEEAAEFGKYMPVCVEGKWYAHPLGLNLYGLNVNKDNIKKEGYALLYEGEKSPMIHEGFSMPNCAVATCGSNLNKYQIKLLLKTCRPKEIILCYDREEVGTSDKYFNKLKDICNKYKNYCQMSFIYDMKGITEMKDAPCDKGEEIFRKLLNERIIVK